MRTPTSNNGASSTNGNSDASGGDNAPSMSINMSSAPAEPEGPSEEELLALQHQYHRTTKCGVAPDRLAPELVIIHDPSEYRAVVGKAGCPPGLFGNDPSHPGWPETGTLRAELRENGTGSLGMHDILHGFHYIMKLPQMSPEEKGKWRPSSETEIVVLSSPEFNALEMRYDLFGRPEGEADFVADHHFERREVPEEEDRGRDVVKRGLAKCKGCYEKGYVDPERRITCDAFGVPEPERPEEVPEEWIRRSKRWLEGGPAESSDEEDGATSEEQAAGS